VTPTHLPRSHLRGLNVPAMDRAFEAAVCCPLRRHSVLSLGLRAPVILRFRSRRREGASRYSSQVVGRLAGAVLAVLAFTGTALAYFAPSLTSVGVGPSRHAVATFSASGADGATIYFATKPDRASDGNFFDENIKHLDLLTDGEIQNGHWVDEGQLDPGAYYVMLRADCFRFEDTSCADGFSNIVMVTVPVPTIRYSTRITTVFRGISVYAEIRASALGVNKQYRLCYATRTRTQRCRNETINGYSWNSSASDEVRIAVLRSMATVTTFTWRVDGRIVGRKKARVR
jgi:hypothetical protein